MEGQMVRRRPLPGPAATPSRLRDAPLGECVTVVAIDPDHLEELAFEGVHVGSLVTVRGRAPLGGPLLVGVGRARVAVARVVADAVTVRPTDSSL
jgi:Fe2+ transport system protein FeoA